MVRFKVRYVVLPLGKLVTEYDEGPTFEVPDAKLDVQQVVTIDGSEVHHDLSMAMKQLGELCRCRIASFSHAGVEISSPEDWAELLEHHRRSKKGRLKIRVKQLWQRMRNAVGAEDAHTRNLGLQRAWEMSLNSHTVAMFTPHMVATIVHAICNAKLALGTRTRSAAVIASLAGGPEACKKLVHKRSYLIERLRRAVFSLVDLKAEEMSKAVGRPQLRQFMDRNSAKLSEGSTLAKEETARRMLFAAKLHLQNAFLEMIAMIVGGMVGHSAGLNSVLRMRGSVELMTSLAGAGARGFLAGVLDRNLSVEEAEEEAHEPLPMEKVGRNQYADGSGGVIHSALLGDGSSTDSESDSEASDADSVGTAESVMTARTDASAASQAREMAVSVIPVPDIDGVQMVNSVRSGGARRALPNMVSPAARSIALKSLARLIAGVNSSKHTYSQSISDNGDPRPDDDAAMPSGFSLSTAQRDSDYLAKLDVKTRDVPDGSDTEPQRSRRASYSSIMTGDSENALLNEVFGERELYSRHGTSAQQSWATSAIATPETDILHTPVGYGVPLIKAMDAVAALRAAPVDETERLLRLRFAEAGGLAEMLGRASTNGSDDDRYLIARILRLLCTAQSERENCEDGSVGAGSSSADSTDEISPWEIWADSDILAEFGVPTLIVKLWQSTTGINYEYPFGKTYDEAVKRRQAQLEEVAAHRSAGARESISAAAVATEGSHVSATTPRSRLASCSSSRPEPHFLLVSDLPPAVLTPAARVARHVSGALWSCAASASWSMRPSSKASGSSAPKLKRALRQLAVAVLPMRGSSGSGHPADGIATADDPETADDTTHTAKSLGSRSIHMKR